MQRARAELSPSLAQALELREANASDEEIAAALDIDRHGVALLLTVANAKLRRLIAEKWEANR